MEGHAGLAIGEARRWLHEGLNPIAAGAESAVGVTKGTNDAGLQGL